ncbi:MAG TPA: protein-tyrosine-phosphatase [Bacteroidia bacterium]|nr:protein-tyrosine-phosphatase [Bacteroidia bacterium]
MIQESRLEKLKQIQDYIKNKIHQKEEVNLIFICVQNSRRSHLAQVLAQHAAIQNNFSNVNCFSGGVEVTRIHPNTIEAFKRFGFSIIQKSEGDNPLFEIDIEGIKLPLYSKNFEEVTKQLKSFAAIMVCSETETNCPYVPNAEKKILLPYDDPKIADNTINPTDEYIRVANIIKEEMQYIFSNIKELAIVR